MDIPNYRLREALRFMLLSPADRLHRAQAHVRFVGVIPSHMDDVVLDELHQRGYTRHRLVPAGAEPEIGATVVTKRGKLYVVEVTSAGEMWLENEGEQT